MRIAKIGFYTILLCAMILLLVGTVFIIKSHIHIDDGILNDREVIEKIITDFGFSDFDDVRNNSTSAISKYENKSIDTEPVFILARIEGVTEDPKAYLHILSYDEDGDLSGIIIKEHIFYSNGNKKYIEEDYPVFKFWSPPRGAFPLIIFVQIRKSSQLKSEEIWNKYISGENIERDKISNAIYWGDTLPTVYISVPEPNKVEVEMYLYDKAGHKSKPILLRHVEVE